MTTFSFNTGIPAANNNPSADQSIMQTNNASTKSIIGTDHITFGTAPATVGSIDGQHLQVTFNGIHSPGAQTDPLSTAYTNNSATMAQAIGSATTISQNFFRNQNGIFPLSSLRAFANFTSLLIPGVGLPVTPNNSFNVVSITATITVSSETYVVTLVANAVNGNNVIVTPFVNANTFGVQDIVTYTFANPTLTITTTKGLARFINFIVLQV